MKDNLNYHTPLVDDLAFIAAVGVSFCLGIFLAWCSYHADLDKATAKTRDLQDLIAHHEDVEAKLSGAAQQLATMVIQLKGRLDECEKECEKRKAGSYATQ